MYDQSEKQYEIIDSVPGIERMTVTRPGDVALGSSALREVVAVERVSNPTGVIGHPSNPVTNQAEAYANSLRREE